MKIIWGTENLNIKFNNPVMTVGNFDGIHMGHQRIFREVKETALKLKGDAIVYTFEPHPLTVLLPHKRVSLIASFADKMTLIEQCGIDMVICEPFTPEYAELSP